MIPAMLPNMASGFVSLTFGTKGYNACTLSACASSSHSIGEAARKIERGDAKVMIAGGTEGSLTELCVGGFAAMRALSTRNDSPSSASRPYDTSRDGFVFSEGAAMLILEDYEFAKMRGARIYCELAGYGYSSDAAHISAPTVEGPARSMRMALKEAKIHPSDVQYLNAHATSTPLGDTNELNAIASLFGDNTQQLSISSTKAVTGHMLGAAGAMEAVLTVKALESNFVPPSANIEQLDDTCGLDVTPNEGKSKSIEYALSNSFGFSGTNASLLFKKLGE